jgi:hypothetical protein
MTKFILAASLLVFSCSKENKAKCYKCEVSGSGGIGTTEERVCTDRIDTIKFHTLDGRKLSASCTPL